MIKFAIALICGLIALYTIIAHLYDISRSLSVDITGWLIFCIAAIIFGGALAVIGLHFSDISDIQDTDHTVYPETQRPILFGFLTSICLILFYSVYFASIAVKDLSPTGGSIASVTDISSGVAVVMNDNHTQQIDTTTSDTPESHTGGSTQITSIDTQKSSKMHQSGDASSPIGGGISGEVISTRPTHTKITRPTSYTTQTKPKHLGSQYDFPVPPPGERLFLKFE